MHIQHIFAEIDQKRLKYLSKVNFTVAKTTRPNNQISHTHSRTNVTEKVN